MPPSFDDSPDPARSILIAYLFLRNLPMNRRTFLASSSVALLAAPAVAEPPQRIAAVRTEYWLGSHADVVIGKYLEGYNQDDKPPYPRSTITAMLPWPIPKDGSSPPMEQED